MKRLAASACLLLIPLAACVSTGTYKSRAVRGRDAEAARRTPSTRRSTPRCCRRAPRPSRTTHRRLKATADSLASAQISNADLPAIAGGQIRERSRKKSPISPRTAAALAQEVQRAVRDDRRSPEESRRLGGREGRGAREGQEELRRPSGRPAVRDRRRRDQDHPAAGQAHGQPRRPHPVRLRKGRGQGRRPQESWTRSAAS